MCWSACFTFWPMVARSSVAPNSLSMQRVPGRLRARLSAFQKRGRPLWGLARLFEGAIANEPGMQ